MQVGSAMLWLGDSLDVEISGADLVLSDPPYLLTSGGDTEGGMSGGWREDYNNDGQIVLCEIDWSDILRVIERALGPNADAYVFANDKNVRPMLNAAHAVGLKQHNLLVWDKVSPTPNRWYMKSLEFVGYFWKGTARTINDPSAKQLLRASQKDVSKHPTEKPVGLCQVYIENSTDRGGLVVDPFMGSGTTGVAALRAGRRFVGVEKEERWFDVAVDRIRAEVERAQPSLFEVMA